VSLVAIEANTCVLKTALLVEAASSIRMLSSVSTISPNPTGQKKEKGDVFVADRAT
jgi:hypothetical protein